MTPRPGSDAWVFWQKSAKALEDLNALYQLIGEYAAEEHPQPLPDHLARQFNSHANDLRINFDQMRHSLRVASLVRTPRKAVS